MYAIANVGCIICHPLAKNTHLFGSSFINTSWHGTIMSKTWLVQDNLTLGSTSLKKHVHNYYKLGSLKCKETKGGGHHIWRWKKVKKCKGVSPSNIMECLRENKSCYSNHDPPQVRFIEDLVFYIAKVYKALHTIEKIWLWRLVMGCKPKSIFSLRPCFWSTSLQCLRDWWKLVCN